MKVFYHSALQYEEIKPNSEFLAMPIKAVVEIEQEKDESPYDLMYNGIAIDSCVTVLECNAETEFRIRQDGNWYTYSVRPLKPLSGKLATAYERFLYEFQKKEFDEITSIQEGNLKLYAFEESAEVKDWTEEFNTLEKAFLDFKAISEKPISHLKSINEVRPIETVKRIGYESIPYLAAHSEDWLARTASGLKPARLFSRVEDDEYQIYENRVVKTLIDLIINFLRKERSKLNQVKGQLKGICSACSAQTDSFGFDVSFQKAVSELMSSDEQGYEYRSNSLEKAEFLYDKASYLLKKYRSLRQLKLYRYLKKSKPVNNPLNETNILVLDKHYKVIFKLWKIIHRAIAPKVSDERKQADFNNTCTSYRQFCATLCGYAAHVLNFKLCEDGGYFREEDQIRLEVNFTDKGNICVTLADKEKRSMEVPENLDLPIVSGETIDGFFFDGIKLYWPNDISDSDIDSFCSRFKTRKSRGKEQQEEKKKFIALKQSIYQAQKSYSKPLNASFLIIPIAVELEKDNRSSFISSVKKIKMKSEVENPEELIVIGLPLCNENEQKVIDYAKNYEQSVAILLLTMFDINSYRRIQNILYRMILKLGKETCPNCGAKMLKLDNQLVCKACNYLTLTKTQCSNSKCRKEYYYLGYDVPETTIKKMQAVIQEDFFQWDSLYQYKDIVDMTVDSGRIRTVCPYCHNN